MTKCRFLSLLGVKDRTLASISRSIMAKLFFACISSVECFLLRLQRCLIWGDKDILLVHILEVCMANPLVSVIVAAYNVEQYISECIESILLQDYDNFEVICVNDASIDNTALILEKYRQRDSRVHVINKSENSGLSAVRNLGVDSAQGKYILFVDGDDKVAINLISETVLCAEMNELDEVSFCYKIFTGERAWQWEEKNVGLKNVVTDNVVPGRQMLVVRDKMLKTNNGHIASCTAVTWLYNRDFLLENRLRFLEGIVHEDIIFWFQCCLCAKRVMVLEKELYFYRRNTGSITTSWHNNRAKSLFSVISLIYADWIKNSFTEEENDAIASMLRLYYTSYMRAQLCGETGDVEVNPAIDFAYNFFLGSLPYKWGQLSAEAFEELRKGKKIFVYGAGRAATDVFEQLNKKHLKPVGVIVSHQSGNPVSFGGVPVKILEEWGEVDDAVVILAITNKYSKGIEQKLHQYGYKQIIKVQGC